jgi:hypothetical protein
MFTTIADTIIGDSFYTDANNKGVALWQAFGCRVTLTPALEREFGRNAFLIQVGKNAPLNPIVYTHTNNSRARRSPGVTPFPQPQPYPFRPNLKLKDFRKAVPKSESEGAIAVVFDDNPDDIPPPPNFDDIPPFELDDPCPPQYPYHSCVAFGYYQNNARVASSVLSFDEAETKFHERLEEIPDLVDKQTVPEPTSMSLATASVLAIGAWSGKRWKRRNETQD